jgi:hypothetical protein
VRLEGLGQLKKSTSSGFESATFWLVAHCLNQLRYHVPPVAHCLNQLRYCVPPKMYWYINKYSEMHTTFWSEKLNGFLEPSNGSDHVDAF